MPTLDHSLSEEDVKLRYISPAIQAKGWSVDDISMEVSVKLTDGKMDLRGNKVTRQKPKFADYVLYYTRTTPIAIVEAKDQTHEDPGFGMQQAMEYAEMMHVPFAYSSNGLAFVEHDFLTGRERRLGMDQFPSKEELRRRFLSESHGGEGLSEQELQLIAQPFCTGVDIYPPRYYQRNAVNLTLEAFAQRHKRMLLVMATGTGKTYVAFQIIYRLLSAGLIRKVLYLADRNILVDQSIQQDFRPLNKVVHKVSYQHDVGDPGRTAYQVYFALYQQLIGEEGKRQYAELFDADFFDLIIVDECHRGSAAEDSQWREILEYFDGAVQLGMTATPRETIAVSNISYFGYPVYTYSLNQGIEDGFLAPFRVINMQTNIGDGWRPMKGQTDFYGNEIPDRIYNNRDYDYSIVIADRIREVAEQITKYLHATDRMAKTIVFCADKEHAERMRQALATLNSDLVSKYPNYVVRITGSDDYGRGQLDYFISVSQPLPVIATTSKLLSTGVDCKMVKLIVLDQSINSMTEFKQIIGRGTRLREDEGKTHFTIMDFRNVTHLFADPEWDGPIEVSEGFDPTSHPTTGPKPKDYPTGGEGGEGGDGDEVPHEPMKPYVERDGCQVQVTYSVVSIYDTEGKLLRTESITDYTRRIVREQYGRLDSFTIEWRNAEIKSDITRSLTQRGVDLQLLKREMGMEETDDFDFISHLAYGTAPLTRAERAKRILEDEDFLKGYQGIAQDVMKKLLQKYVTEGIGQLEDINVLRVKPFTSSYSPARIIQAFGGRNKYLSAVHSLTQRIYSNLTE